MLVFATIYLSAKAKLDKIMKVLLSTRFALQRVIEELQKNATQLTQLVCKEVFLYMVHKLFVLEPQRIRF